MDETSLLKHFGDRVRAERLKLGLSQEKLAFDSGLDRTYISAIERGKRNLSLLNIHRLAAAFGLPTADLLKDGGGLQ
jgi:transcriptional regulator with XRE-family HTH domain